MNLFVVPTTEALFPYVVVCSLLKCPVNAFDLFCSAKHKSILENGQGDTKGKSPDMSPVIPQIFTKQTVRRNSGRTA